MTGSLSYKVLQSILVTASQQLPGLLVSLLCPLNHNRGHLPSLPVKAALQTFLEPGRRQPVSQVLLIKTRLWSTGFVLISRPVPRRVWGEEFVDENDILRHEIHAEFELGVGEDQPLGYCVV